MRNWLIIGALAVVGCAAAVCGAEFAPQVLAQVEESGGFRTNNEGWMA